MSEGIRTADAARAPGRAQPLADVILRLIWEERHISRAEIARRAELSRSTVSEIVDALLATSLIAEAGIGESSGGRRPIVLEFQDDACSILGVDIGATHVSVVLTNLRGHVLAWQHRKHPVQTDPAGTRALVALLCESCLVGLGPRRDRLVGIGIAVPSPVDPRHPERLSIQGLPAWEGRHGLEFLGEQFGVPLFIDNDANLGALAEHWWGAARGLDDFAYLKIATGIGSGHFIGGRIYRGASGVAGEIGHLTIDARGELCVCGNRGCLVTYIGAKPLIRRATALLEEFPRSSLAEATISMEAIEDAAMAGDPMARQVVLEAAQYLGIAIAGVLNLMNPAAVILGGGLAQLKEQLLVPLRETVMRRTFVSAVASSEIHTSALGDRGVALGAATLVLDAALQDPRLFPTLGAT